VTTLAVAVRVRTFRSLRRHRNYRLFFAGQVVSLAGTWMQNVALAWLVLELSGSALAVGVLAFCRFLPFTVLGLVAGVVTDRVETRRLIAVTQGAAMLVSVLLAVVTLTGAPSLPLVYVLATLGGITLAFDAPGRQALTFQLVGPRELPNAVALNSGLFNASRVVGPAVAGVLIATAGTGFCFAINALSFLAVLAALALIRADEMVAVERDGRPGLVTGTREAVVHAWNDPVLRGVLGVVTAVSLVGFNFHVLVPLLAVELEVDAATFGLLSAAFGVGALAGALVVATARGASRRGFTAGTAGFSVLLALLGLTGVPWLAAILLAGLGICFTLLTANANALVQLRAPDRLRGRLISLYLLAFAGLAPFGGLLAGWVAETAGTAVALATAGAVGLAALASAHAHWRTLP
jgi:MFS family permease